MKVSISTQEALEILQLEGFITQEKIKSKYRILAKKYHPDRNPDGLRLMQEVNIAYDYLSGLPMDFFREEKKESAEDKQFAHFRSWGLSITEDGEKIYISGKTFDFREQLKELRFRWNPNKKNWWRLK